MFEQIEARLAEGWGVTLISTITPNVVRLQLCGKDEQYEARACAEGSTLEQAIQNAVLFTKSTTPAEWESEFWTRMERAGDEPFCNCPKCDKSLSFDPDEDACCEMQMGYSQFTCARCGTVSVWELGRAFPIMVGMVLQ